MKKLVKKYLSHLLYQLGNALGKVLDHDWVGGKAYPLYNWLMVKSAELQGVTNDGPWNGSVLLEKAKEAMEESFPGIEWVGQEDGSLIGVLPSSMSDIKVSFTIKGD